MDRREVLVALAAAIAITPKADAHDCPAPEDEGKNRKQKRCVKKFLRALTEEGE